MNVLGSKKRSINCIQIKQMHRDKAPKKSDEKRQRLNVKVQNKQTNCVTDKSFAKYIEKKLVKDSVVKANDGQLMDNDVKIL